MSNPNRSVRCTNENGVSYTFGNVLNDAQPFLLTDAEGIYGAEANVTTSANTMTDGSTYQGTTMAMRNIVLTLRDAPWANHRKNRDRLYALFKYKAPGTLSFTEDGVTREIDYYVESITPDSVPRSRTYTISLLCPDAFFRDTQDTVVEMGGWVSGFEFLHEFFDEGEEFGTRSMERLGTIVNESAADNIGVTITIEAVNGITNPEITIVETQESIKLGTPAAPLSLNTGDVLVITTGRGNKHCMLTSGGIKQDVNAYLTQESEFVQLSRGNNTFSYTADSGAENMMVTISYRFLYAGV